MNLPITFKETKFEPPVKQDLSKYPWQFGRSSDGLIIKYRTNGRAAEGFVIQSDRSNIFWREMLEKKPISDISKSKSITSEMNNLFNSLKFHKSPETMIFHGTDEEFEAFKKQLEKC